jgi:hypothetical protein
MPLMHKIVQNLVVDFHILLDLFSAYGITLYKMRRYQGLTHQPILLFNTNIIFLRENLVMHSQKILNEQLISACTNGDEVLVKELLKQPELGNEINNTLINAAWHGHVNIVSFLLDDDRVNLEKSTPIAFLKACTNNHLNVVKFMLTTKFVQYLNSETINIMQNMMSADDLTNVIACYKPENKSLVFAYWASKQDDGNALNTALTRKIIDEEILSRYLKIL